MYAELDSRLKELKTHKGKISSQFKNIQKNSEEHLKLLDEMKLITAKIKDIEQNIKSINACEPTTSSSIRTIDVPLPILNENNNFPGCFNLTLEPFNQHSDWNEFVIKHKLSLPSHNPAWLKAIELSFGHNSFILCARDTHGNIIGGIAITEMKSFLFGHFGASTPYLNYGGPLTEYFNVAKKLTQELKNVCNKLNLSHIEIRSLTPNLAPNPSNKKVSMLLKLPTSNSELDKNLGSKLRAQLKKADENFFSFSIGKENLFSDFYAVFSQHMRDLGTPVYSKKWFLTILNYPNLAARIIIVYHKGRPVSCAMVIAHRNILEIPWASTLKSANKLNANMWMYRKILEVAIQENFDFFDFGRSTKEAKTHKFKKQWGSLEVQHYWYFISDHNDRNLTELNPDNPKLKLLINLWKKLPIFLSNFIGPKIVRGIP